MRSSIFLVIMLPLTLIIYSSISLAVQDCTATPGVSSICNCCDVNSMTVKVYAPSGSSVSGPTTMMYSTSSGACGETPAVTESWISSLGYTFCPVEGTYNGDITSSSAGGNSACQTYSSEISTNTTLYTVNWDIDSNWCTCKAGSTHWNIGGEIAATNCCGDDANENKITRTCDSGICTSDSSDDACCDTSTDCVYSSICYANNYLGDVDSDGRNENCNSGIWKDIFDSNDCGGSSGNPCNVCDVTNMSIKIYSSLGALLGTEYLIYNSESGTCGTTPSTTEIWKKTLGTSYFNQVGTYHVTVYVQMVGGDWEYSTNFSIIISSDCVGTNSTPCHICDVTDMYANIYDMSDHLISTEYLSYSSESGTCGTTPETEEIWSKLIQTSISQEGTYKFNVFAQINFGEWENSQNFSVVVDSFSVPVSVGWNLISIPMKEVMQINDPCGALSGQLYYWNSTTKEWTTMSGISLKGGNAYWFRSEKSCTVDFMGASLVTVQDIPPMKAGYNFIGSLSTSSNVNSIKGNCNIRSTTPLYWDTSSQSWVTSDMIDLYKGYWIYVESDCRFS
jgi:hypothetical protein